jgi:hypothetical protein
MFGPPSRLRRKEGHRSNLSLLKMAGFHLPIAGWFYVPTDILNVALSQRHKTTRTKPIELAH